MGFDPNQPFDLVDDNQSGFDPNQPFDLVQDEYKNSFADEAKAVGRDVLENTVDVGYDLLGGAVAVPEAAVGVADIFTGGKTGKFLEENVGFRPQEAKNLISGMQSEGRQLAQKEFNAADGFANKMGVALQNPALIGGAAIGSLPSMGAGGVIGKGAIALAPKMSGLVASALGEGVVGAGTAAEGIRGQTEDRLLTPEQSALAAGTGVATSAFSLLGGKLAKQFGIADADTLLVGAASNPMARKAISKAAVQGFVSEGLLEELPQSVSEQILQNQALGRPLDEGVDDAAVMGILSGGVTGSAVGGYNAGGNQDTTDQTVNGIRPEGFGDQPATDMPSRDQFETDADYQAAFNEAMDAKEKQTAEPMTESATVAPVEKTQEEIDHDTEVQKYAEGLKTQAEKEGIDAEAKAAKDAMTRAEKNMKAVAGLDPSEPGYQAAYQSLSEALALKKAVESKKVAFDEKVKSVPDAAISDAELAVNEADKDADVSRNLDIQVEDMMAEIAAQENAPDSYDAAEDKPVESKPIKTESFVGSLEPTKIPLDQLSLSKDIPQFKSGANERGIVEPLQGKFDPVGVGPIQVWRRKDGKLEVISGRHRFDLANRDPDTNEILAQVHDEASGFDAKQAAALDSILNIRENQGKVKDYVTYFRNTGTTKESAEQQGILGRKLGQRAWEINDGGSDALVASLDNDQITEEAAYQIAKAAPKDEGLQALGIKALQEGKSISVAANMMQAVKAIGSEGAGTVDMFGFDDSAMKMAESMAKVAAKRQREIQQRVAAVSGAAKNPELAAKEGVSVKDPKAVLAKIEELKKEKERWDSWSTDPELVASIKNEIDPERFSLGENKDEDGDITDETQVPMFMKMASDARSDLIKQGRVVRALSFQAETRPELSQKLTEERAKLRALSNRYWNMAERRTAPKVELSWKAKQKFNAAKRSLKKSIDDVKFLLGGKTKQRSITFIERKDIAKAEADEKAMRDIAREKRPAPTQKGDNTPLAMKADKAAGKKTSAEIKAAIDKAMPYMKGHVEVIDSVADLDEDVQNQLKAIGADGTERGVYLPKQNKAYVFASNNRDAGEAIVAAMHEVVGHKGVYAVLGKEKSKVLSALANSKDAGIQKVADAVRRTYAESLDAIEKSYGKAASDAMLGAEIVARISESNVNIPVIKRVKLMLADTLSKITGRSKVESVADVELLLKRSRDYLKSGAKPTKPTGGKPVAMKVSKDAVTDSAAFKKWFGDSKVVDENGKPLVVYHGTRESFDEFDISQIGQTDQGEYGQGFYFAKDPNESSWYAGTDEMMGDQDTGGNVMPVYLSLRNPYIVKHGGFGKTIDTVKLKSDGYDGVIAIDDNGIFVELVAFKPNQIKSATGNNGGFDPKNDSILMMRSPKDAAQEAINSITRKPTARRFTAKAMSFAARNLTKERGLTAADYSARDEALGIRMEINGVIAPKVSQAFQNEWKKLYGKDDFSKHPDIIYNVLKFMRGEKATLPAELQKVAMMMRNEIDAASDKVRDVIKDRVKYSTDAMNANSLAAFSQYLTDAKAISESQLPEEAKDKQIEMAAQQAIKEARGDKNAESQAGLVAQAITDISMVQTLEAGKGSYLNRAYQAHNDPHWRSRIIDDTVPYGDPDHIIDKKVYDAAAADILKANADATEDEIYNAISTILLKADSVANPMAHLGLSSEIKKLGVLKRRKLDDMPGVRRLLGEYQNPVNIFSTTLAKQGNIVAAHHFMKTMRENGLETGLMSEKQGGANQYQIQGGKGMEPLSGLWTTVEYGKTIEAILEKMPSGAVSRMILTAAGAIKKGKTVLSPSTAAVNLISNFTASWRNGHIGGVEQHAKAISLVWKYIHGDKAAIDTVKRMADLGIFSESAYQTEFDFMFEDKAINEYASFIDKNMPEILKNGVKAGSSLWKKIDDGMSHFYQGSDTIWKTSGFLQEVERYKGRGMSQVEAEKAAAERIKDTYPTYNRVSAFVDILKRNPFFSDFPSFAWEQARTSYHQAKYIKQDFEQGYKADAIRGVANYAFGIGALPVLAWALSAANGWDDEEVQDYIKMFGADWMRHGSYILSEPDEKGNVTPINLGRLNMYDTQVKMVKSMITAIRNGDMESFVTDPIIIAFKSLVGIEFTAQAITDAFDGVDAYGEKLSDANASSSEMAVDRLKYLFKTLGPTLITQQGGNLVKANASTINEALDKAGLGSIAVEGATKGREFSNKNEAMSLIGLRTHTDATPRVLSRIARTELSDASRDIGKVKALLSSTDKVPDAQIQEYVNDALDNSYRRKERIAKAAAMLIDKGVEKALLADALETANVKQSDVSKYLRGEVPEYDPSKTTLSNMKEAMGKYNVPRADIHHRLIVFKKAIKEYNSQKE